MIVVTGASGKLGRAVIEHLLDRVPAERIGASVRDPQRIEDLEHRGVRVRPGDFADPAGLAHAFEGASRVLVVSSNSIGGGAVHNRAAIEAAVAAGAGRVLYTSHMGAGPTSPFWPMLEHAATEEVLAGAGVPSTALRHGFYASTVPMLLRGALETGELRVPEDGPVAWTAHADLAEAAAIALSGDDPLDGPTPPLTGAEALEMTEVAAIASDVVGREIRRVVVSEADYRADLIETGAPAAAADMLVGLFAAGRRGDFAPADPTLSRVLGRSPTPLAEVLRAHLAPAAA